MAERDDVPCVTWRDDPLVTAYVTIRWCRTRGSPRRSNDISFVATSARGRDNPRVTQAMMTAQERWRGRVVAGRCRLYGRRVPGAAGRRRGSETTQSVLRPATSGLVPWVSRWPASLSGQKATFSKCHSRHKMAAKNGITLSFVG
jgi:hypothetical protein